jgi:type I restriction enzyme S subunit
MPYLGLDGVEANSTRVLSYADSEIIRGSGKPFSRGYTLYARLRPYLNKVCAPEVDGVASTEFIVFPSTTALAPRFLLYLLNNPQFVEFANSHAEGIERPRLSWQQMSTFAFGLPPHAEQERIVAAIEEHLSRLEAAKRLLTTANTRLQTIRRAALTKAIPPSRWPAVRLADVGNGSRHALAIGPFGSNLKVSDYRDEGVPLVFVRNIRLQRFDGADTRYVSVEKARALAAHRIQGGDVLITKMGDPPGDSTVYPLGAPDAVITADCVKISVGASFDPYFVALAIEAPEAHHQVLAATKGVAQKKVSLGRFKQVTIPAPPLEEQRRIVSELDFLFSAITNQQGALEQVQHRMAALRHSILVRAFRGELVAQDPNDEPASALLERIAVDRAAIPEPKRTRRAKAPA